MNETGRNDIVDLAADFAASEQMVIAMGEVTRDEAQWVEANRDIDGFLAARGIRVPDALTVVKGWREAGQNIAETAWRVSFETTEVDYFAIPGGVRASAKLKLKTGKHAISLPVWTNVPNDLATESAWQEVRKLLLAHEVGHVRITDDYVRKINEIPVSGIGSDEPAARTDLQRDVDRVMDHTRQKINELHNAYDSQTEHGLQQSKVGGKDVVLVCPPK